MSKVVFKLNAAGVRDLMRSDEMTAVCEKYADNALSQLGDGYSSSTHTGKNRVNVSVMAETYKARLENSQNNSILKAVLSK